MKKLSLFLFTILILGCGIETTVVEEPEPIEPPPVEPIGHPLIAQGSVKNGEVNVDPAPLNSSGIRFIFTKSFYRYQVWFYDQDNEPLHWDSPNAEWNETDFLYIRDWSDHYPLEYDTEYEIVISAQDFDCNYTEIVIQFRTKPQSPGVEEPKPVMQERIPAVAVGERFRFDIDELAIIGGNVHNRDNNVDPEPLNANGIHIEFDREIKRYSIDLQLNGGESLGWKPHGFVENNMKERIQIIHAEGAPLLEFDTIYIMDISVQDLHCLGMRWRIWFRTKPKP